MAAVAQRPRLDGGHQPRDRNGGYWLLDMVYARANPGEVERLMLNTPPRTASRSRSASARIREEAGKSQAQHLARAQQLHRQAGNRERLMGAPGPSQSFRNFA
jgi:hypothetical protein